MTFLVMKEYKTTVLVVGAGPTGLIAGHLLEQSGINTVIAERHQDRLSTPKAHAINSRTLEICHGVGLPMERIHAKAVNREDGRLARVMNRASRPSSLFTALAWILSIGNPTP